MILYRMILGLVALWLMLRHRLAGLPGHGAERIAAPPARSDRPLWLHAASNGELTAARPALQALLARGLPVLITVNSESARALAMGWALPGTSVRLAPLDATVPLTRFLDRTGPRALVVIENELWPNRLRLMAARRIPVLVLGARLSATSAKRWHLLPGLARRLMGAIDWLAPQDDASRARFLSVGLAPDRLGPTLSLKAATMATAKAPAPDAVPDAARDLPFVRALTFLAASTHEGEEDQVLDAFLQAHARHPGLQLILAPRHPRRRDEIEVAIAARGLPLATRSRGKGPGAGQTVYLADTLGEMDLWYQAAGLCFVGGSLTDRGGHTPFEPAAHGAVILHGPNLSNFEDPYRALTDAKAAVLVANADDLAAALIRLAGDAPAQARLAKAALAALSPLSDDGALAPFLAALDRLA